MKKLLLLLSVLVLAACAPPPRGDSNWAELRERRQLELPAVRPETVVPKRQTPTQKSPTSRQPVYPPCPRPDAEIDLRFCNILRPPHMTYEQWRHFQWRYRQSG